jgi:iron complex outermembrane receptor protein
MFKFLKTLGDLGDLEAFGPRLARLGKLGLGAALLALWSLCPAALAQDEGLTLEPLVVTAEKRLEDAQKVPISLTVLSSEKIAEAGIKGIHDVVRRVPNLFMPQWGNRGIGWVFVRGIGAVNNDPAISFNVDGVNYMDSRIFDSPLFDIERVEVLRGPQGTLYGKNSLGGVINIVTKKPDNELHYGAEMTVGRYERFESMAYVRAPLVRDKLYLGASLSYGQMGGYAKNEYLDSEADSQENMNGRLHLRWTPQDNVDISAMIDMERIDDGAYPLQTIESSFKSPRVVERDFADYDQREAFGSSLRASVDFEKFNLTGLVAFRQYDNRTENDQDFTFMDLLRARDDVEDRQFSGELRFSSLPDSGPLKWLGGLYCYSRDRDETLRQFYSQMAAMALQIGFTPFTDTSAFDLSTKGYAAFGQATYTFFDKLGLTLGLRYESEENRMDFVNRNSLGGQTVRMSGERRDNVLLPKAQADYQWTDSVMTYASVARGYRSGGFNTGVINMDPDYFDFQPEYSWNYEIGFKTSFLEDRLMVNGAAFHIDLRDQQVSQIFTDPMSGANYTVIRNAGKAKSSGFELEVAALLGAGFQIDASYGFMNTKFKSYKDNAGLDYGGNRPPATPRYTYSLGLQHSLRLLDSFDGFKENDSLSWVNRLEVQGIGNFYWDEANAMKQGGYNIFNLRTSLKTENVTATLWVNNLFDKHFDAVRMTHPLAGRMPGYTSAVQVGAPLTMGVTVRYDY